MNEHDDLPVVFMLFLFAGSNPHKKKSEQPTNNDVWPKKATYPVDLWGCSPTSTVFKQKHGGDPSPLGNLGDKTLEKGGSGSVYQIIMAAEG